MSRERKRLTFNVLATPAAKAKANWHPFCGELDISKHKWMLLETVWNAKWLEKKQFMAG